MFQEELRQLSIADLQTAISKAIYDMCGAVYHCSVEEMKFTNWSDVDLKLSLSEHNSVFGIRPPPFPLPETSDISAPSEV